MAKKKRETVESTAPFHITSASINDGLCNYSFEITEGVGLGDTHNVKGKGIIYDDLQDAFYAINLHLAIIDGAIEDDEIENPLDFVNDERVANYNITGFKIKGSTEDESVILVGTKHAETISARIDLTTSKIALGAFSGYKYSKQLQAAITNARYEVELYKAGKYTTPEVIEPIDKNQITIGFGEVQDAEFDNAKV